MSCILKRLKNFAIAWVEWPIVKNSRRHAQCLRQEYRRDKLVRAAVEKIGKTDAKDCVWYRIRPVLLCKELRFNLRVSYCKFVAYLAHSKLGAHTPARAALERGLTCHVERSLRWTDQNKRIAC